MYDGSVRIKINGDDTNFRKAIDSTSTSLNGLKSLIVKLGLGAVFAKGIKEGITASNALENSVAKASTLFGSVEVNVGGLEEKIKALSNTTGISADKIGNSLYNALSAGVEVTEDMGDSMEFMEANAKLAVAGFTDIDNAVQATAKVLNAYGKDVIDIDTVSKVLMTTQNLGITTVDQLGSALATVTPVASAFGLSFQQVGASLAVMTKAGTDTNTATTQLRATLNALAQSDTKASKALAEASKKATGQAMSFKELNEAGYTLQEMLRMMQDYAKDTGVSLMDLFGDVRSGTGALQIASDATATYNRFLEEMGNDADIVQEAYDKVMGTRSKTWQQLANRLKNITINITTSQGTQKLLDNITDLADDFLTKIEEWIPAIQRAMNIAYVSGSATFAYLGKLIDNLKNSLVLKPVIDYTSESWQKFKNAVSTGDFSGVLEGLSKGLLLAIGIKEIVGGGLALFKALNVSFMGAGLAGLSVVVALEEAKGDGSWGKVGANLVTALAVGMGIGTFLGSPQAGVLAFSVVLNLKIGEKIGGAIDKLNDAVDGLIEKATGLKKSQFDRVVPDAVLLTVTKQAVEIGEAVNTGIEKGLEETEDYPFEVIKDEGNGLINWFKKVLGIHSPSKEFEKAGKNIIAGLVEGLSTQSELDSAMSKITDLFFAFGESINTAIEDGMNLTEIIAEIMRASSMYDELANKIGGITPAPSSTGTGGGGTVTPAGGTGDAGGVEQTYIKGKAFFDAMSTSMGYVMGDCEKLSDWFHQLTDEEGELTERGQFWADTLNGALQTAFSGFEQLGEALIDGEASWGIFAKAGLQALASIVEAIAYQLLGQAVASYPNFAQMAKAGAMSAVMLTGAGLIRGWANQFEKGGIVGGSGYTGDKHMIWANAGELILNRAQQKNLAGQLGSSGGGNVIHIDFSGNVFGDQQSISEYVYEGIRTAQHNGVIGQWQ